jgi:hypothetical protein
VFFIDKRISLSCGPSLPVMSLDVAFRSIDCHRLFLWGRPDASELQAMAEVNKLCPRDGIITFEILCSFLQVVHEFRLLSGQFEDCVSPSFVKYD